MYGGIFLNGRDWLEDTAGVVGRPKVEKGGVSHQPFAAVDKGASMTLKLVGNNIRPKDLQHFGATTAEQWMCILRVHTPVGGVYLCGDNAQTIRISLDVIDQAGAKTQAVLDKPRYLYPHEVLGKTADLREFLKDQEATAAKGQDLTRIPPRFTGLNGLWGEWTGEDVLKDRSPIKSSLNAQEEAMVADLGLKIYVFMGFSTDLWDHYSDEILKLGKGSRILRGGLQQATKHMPQGNRKRRT